MKLLVKTSLLYLGFALPVIVLSSYICYHLIHREVIANTEEALEKDFMRIEKKFLHGDSLVRFRSYNDEVIVTPAEANYTSTTFSYSDTVLYDEYEEEELPFRVLQVKYAGAGHDYDVQVRKILLETEDLTDGILTAMEVMLGALIVGFFLINFLVSRSLWSPFRKTMNALSQFGLQTETPVAFGHTSTHEFVELNRTLTEMTSRMQRDYRNLKEFTENASHELQTPLAIMRSRIEMMIQQENLPPNQVKHVQELYETLNRLSRLNQSLLLLSKIENRQFQEAQELDMSALADKKLEQLDELIRMKNIQVQQRLSPLQVRMHPQLADILLSNILSNAIRHNDKDGTMIVEANERTLQISNTGSPPSLSSEEMFGRFKKGSPSSESVGLGLSIVKKICDTCGFSVSYTFENGFHSVRVVF